MINFIEGKIYFGENQLCLNTAFDAIEKLAKQKLVDKRRTGRGTIYYYVEASANGTRFGVFITLQDKHIEWIRLSWLDSSMKSWEDISEKAVKEEYHMLLNLVENLVGRPADNKGNRLRSWIFHWGQIDVTYDLRAFQADIFMKPQKLKK